jgi:hypothetical protein
MTLPSSFPISKSQINLELGRPADAAFDIQGTTERNLARVPSGAISFSDFLGKTRTSVQYLGSTSSAVNGTVYTVSSATIGNLGADEPTREIFFVVGGYSQESANNDFLTNVKVGTGNLVPGIMIDANQPVGYTGSASGHAICSIPFPTGSTFPDNVIFTYGSTSGGLGGFFVAWYRVLNRSTRSSLVSSAYQSTSGSGTVANPPALAIQNGGFALGSFYTDNNGLSTLTDASGAGWVINANQSTSHRFHFASTPVQTSAVSSTPSYSQSNGQWSVAEWAYY